MARLRLIKGTKGTSPKNLNKKLDKFIKSNSDEQLRIGANTLNFMKSFIRNNVKREGSTGNLENSITLVVPDPTSKSAVYIGDKDKMSSQAPYWYVVNYGKTTKGGKFIPPPNYGIFGQGTPPQPGVGTEQWTHLGAKAKKFADFIIPKTFTPINYIQAGVNYLKLNWNKTYKGKKLFK